MKLSVCSTDKQEHISEMGANEKKEVQSDRDYSWDSMFITVVNLRKHRIQLSRELGLRKPLGELVEFLCQEVELVLRYLKCRGRNIGSYWLDSAETEMRGMQKKLKNESFCI